MAEARREKPAAAGTSACFEKATALGETEKGSEGKSKVKPPSALQPTGERACAEKATGLGRETETKKGRDPVSGFLRARRLSPSTRWL